MCEMATEIQALWEPFPGDFTNQKAKTPLYQPDGIVCDVYNSTGHRDEILYLLYFKDALCEEVGNSYSAKDYIWLPRQDQLQDMLNCDGVNHLVIEINDFCFGNRTAIHAMNFDSMEQLWLALVMNIKFSKLWDDTANEWVINNNKGA